MTGLLLQLAILSLWPVLLGGLLLLIAWGGFLAVDAITYRCSKPIPPEVDAPSAAPDLPPANVYYLADRAKARRSAG
jgi:hypothetical protein